MSEKMKGIEIIGPYDFKKFKGEVNDEGSETVTTGYIPIDEQVKMIIRGEVTIGNLESVFESGFENADDDIEKESPEEYFEDSVDIGSMYQDDVRDAISGAIQKGTGDTSEQKSDTPDVDNSEQSDGARVAEQQNDVSE